LKYENRGHNHQDDPEASMESFTAGHEFTAYGPSHVVVLSIFALGAVLLILIGRRSTDAQARVLSRVLAMLILLAFVAALAYKIARPDIQTSIPLQLCDLAELVAAYALWSQRNWAFALTYYWCLLLSSQALLTPDIGTAAEGAPDFPNHLFVTFFVLHVLVVWSAIYLTWGRGMRPSWHDFRYSVAVTLGWVAFTLAFNTIADTNYGYLNRKPPTTSILDAVGPWPFYVLIEIVVVILVWAAMTWPWQSIAEFARTDKAKYPALKHEP
jgi:hypothetical integral membrane protein (TIGR02206 family)